MTSASLQMLRNVRDGREFSHGFGGGHYVKVERRLRFEAWIRRVGAGHVITAEGLAALADAETMAAWPNG